MLPDMKPRTWIFDLDDTLHRASPKVFAVIDRAMTRYIEEQLAVDPDTADRLRRDYWQRYGATLHGLVRHHDVDAAHFLHATHPLAAIRPLLQLFAGVRPLLRRLRGRKVLFTNGPHHYAQALLRQLRIQHHFDAIIAIEQLRLQPKPQRKAFHQLLRRQRLSAGQCVLIDDSHANIVTATRLGMHGLWLAGRHRRNSRVRRVARLSAVARLR